MMSRLGASRHRAAGFSPGLLAVMHPEITSVEATPGSRIARMITDSPIAHRSRNAGEYLFHAGDDFCHLHVLNAGFAKTCYVSEDGREQTIGFHLRGDILGLDAIAAGTHGRDAVALDQCEVLEIPYDVVIAHGQRNPDLLLELHRAFSAEIRSERDLMLSMGNLPAEGRLAAFLLELSLRFAARGFSATQLPLRLTPQEIGSLLALKPETVSRALSRIARLGLIRVEPHEIVLLDRDRLLDIIAPPSGLERGSNELKEQARYADAGETIVPGSFA